MKRRVEINKKLILLNSLSGIISKILNILLLIWLNQFLIKNIPVAEYSIYPVAMSIMMLVMMMRAMLSGGLARHVTEAYAKNDMHQIEELTSTGLLIQSVGAVLIIIFGIIFSLNIENIFTFEEYLIDDAQLIFGILIISFGIRQVFVPFEAGLQVKQKFAVINIIELSGVLIRILVIALFFNFVSIAIIWVVLAAEVAQVFGVIMRVFLSHRNVPEIKFKLKSIKFSKIPELLTFSLWLFLTNFAAKIQSSADPIFLNKFSDPFNITCFHVGSLFKKQIQTMQDVVVITFIPALTAMHVENDTDRIKRTFIRFGKYFIWAYMLIALPLVIFRREFIQLYIGKEYLLASSVMLFLLFDSLLTLGSTLTFYVAMAVNKVKKISLLMLATQIFNLALTTYLVGFNRMGALGSAAATFITNFAISTLLIVPAGLKLTNTSLKEYISEIMKPGFLPSLAIFLPFLLLELFLPPQTWFSLILYAVSFVTIYIAFLYFFGADKEDISMIKKILRRKK